MNLQANYSWIATAQYNFVSLGAFWSLSVSEVDSVETETEWVSRLDSSTNCCRVLFQAVTVIVARFILFWNNGVKSGRW